MSIHYDGVPLHAAILQYDSTCPKQYITWLMAALSQSGFTLETQRTVDDKTCELYWTAAKGACDKQTLCQHMHKRFDHVEGYPGGWAYKCALGIQPGPHKDHPHGYKLVVQHLQVQKGDPIDWKLPQPELPIGMLYLSN